MIYRILPHIQSIEDLWALPEKELDRLCFELREFMVETVSKTGGHLASSLGAVELIVAMHRVYRSPRDKLVFDVGHQAYAHKILTGRREAFGTSLRQAGGISGFPKREESIHDSFNTGHASTSVSAALGMLRGMALNGETGCAAALIGDGALTGGLAYEALDDAGDSKLPLVVILNDNEMSIAPNVGAMSRNLSMLRSSRGYNRVKRFVVKALDTGPLGRFFSRRLESFKNRIKRFVLTNTFFEEMGFTYLGPVDGHNVHALIRLLDEAKALKKPVLVHAITQKGRGYAFSEEDPEKFHGISPFQVSTGEVPAARKLSCSGVFGQAMLELGGQDPKIVAVTAAMPAGTGLKPFAKAYPQRFFDVGIAEEHAVTMAAGMACQGMKPVVALYSSFLQRSVDTILHDVCLQKLPVVLAVDRAGLVGEDGETHQGLFDPAFLCPMPHMSVYAPATLSEIPAMLKMALQRGEPAALRYNRGTLPQGDPVSDLEYGKWKILMAPAAVTVIAAGVMVPLCRRALEGLGCGLVQARFYKPLDEEMLRLLDTPGQQLLVVEENAPALGPAVAAFCREAQVTLLNTGDAAVPQGTVEEQRRWCGLDKDAVRTVAEALSRKG